ncbi:MAG: IPT/TIG domain-containing protein [Anaerolineaceae bacterium]
MKVRRYLLLTCLLFTALAGTPCTVHALPPESNFQITSCTPETVFNDLDTTLIITGSYFDYATQVFLGSELLSFTASNAETIIATIPAGFTPGTYSLTVGDSSIGTTKVDAVTVKNGINQWVSNGPFGGEVSGILQNPMNKDIFYATVANVGIFRSIDHANNWQFVFDTASPIGNLAMDSGDPTLLYATKSGEGLYRSQDGGDTWTAIPFPGFSRIYTARAFADPNTAQTVYAALNFSDQASECDTACGIYRSTNAGDTWTRISTDIPSSEKVTAITFGSGYLLAGTESGRVYFSTDSDAHWTETVVNWNSSTPILKHVSKLVIQPGGQSRLFWLMEGEGYSGSMYRCDVTNTAGVISLSCNPVNLDGSDSPDPALDIKFNPSDPADILVAGNKPVRSLNGGDSWTFYSAFSAPFQSESVAYDLSSNTSVFGGNLQGLFVNLDATSGVYTGNWTKMYGGMTGLVPKYLVVSPSVEQSVFVNTDGGGLFHSTNGGTTWTELAKFTDDSESQYTLRTPFSVDPNNEMNLIIANWYNGVNISIDGGQNWTASNTLTSTLSKFPVDYSSYTFNFQFLQPLPGQSGKYLAGGFLFDPTNGDNHQAPAGAIYEIQVSGISVNWTQRYLNADLGRIQSVVFDPYDSQKIYCGSYTKDGDGYPSHSALVYSTDGGQTWNYSQTTLMGYTEINTLTMNPSTGILLANGGSDILTIDPKTFTWSVFPNIPGNFSTINMLDYAPALGFTPKVLYAATGQGLYQTTDDGSTWSVASSGLDGMNVTVLGHGSVGTKDGIIYTGAAGGSLASAPTSPVMELDAGSAQSSNSTLVNGGVYHLVRPFTEVYYSYLPFINRP